MDRCKVAVVGAGYVGFPIAVLLSQNNAVTVMDINETTVRKINERISPIKDEDMESFLRERKLTLSATTDLAVACSEASYIILSLPTDLDEKTGQLDCTRIVETVNRINSLSITSTIVIKSTVPIGFTKSLKMQFPKQKILFAPEFIRETRALYDNLFPSRIIIGTDGASLDEARKFADLLKSSAEKRDIEVRFVSESEAEAVKLFSNAYLAMRVSFFNEVDTFAENKGMNTKNLIEGICLDPRIGNFYNNPSFGYGGYCLPKDTRQLQSDFLGIDCNMINAIVDSNRQRKYHIVDRVMEMVSSEDRISRVGIYRLIMKKGSDNFRESPVRLIINALKANGVEIIIYEPILHDTTVFEDCAVIKSLSEFKEKSDLILANRYSGEDLADVSSKVYTRDLFEEN
ncbi:MAG: nucleotide sugar dehydrogenase [Mogibacterium sp.]|nr:nucleotide sugar dehydrogenase [Mogibacterium sp.]